MHSDDLGTKVEYLHLHMHREEIKIHSSGEVVKVGGKLNCKSKSFLYVLESSKMPKGPGSPPSQYVAKSGTSFLDYCRMHMFLKNLLSPWIVKLCQNQI